MGWRPPQDPYATCRCGSGKKYKFCCLPSDRDEGASGVATAEAKPPTADDVRRRFPESARLAGERLVRTNMVTVTEVESDSIDAIVTDGGPRFVTVFFDDEGFDWECDCSRFPRPDPCAHAWAALAAASRRGLIGPLGDPKAPPPSWLELLLA